MQDNDNDDISTYLSNAFHPYPFRFWTGIDFPDQVGSATTHGAQKLQILVKQDIAVIAGRVLLQLSSTPIATATVCTL